jgi:hypothetical protein
MTVTWLGAITCAGILPYPSRLFHTTSLEHELSSDVVGCPGKCYQWRIGGVSAFVR